MDKKYGKLILKWTSLFQNEMLEKRTFEKKFGFNIILRLEWESYIYLDIGNRENLGPLCAKVHEF